MDFRAKLFLVAFALVAASVGFADVFLTRALEDILTQRIRDDMFIRLHLVQREADQSGYSPTDVQAWDALADDLGARARARVTLMNIQGVVTGDSEVPLHRLALVDNHLHRPEVQEALATGRGSSSRFSATVRERMLYAAIPYGPPGAPIGVARVALSLSEVDAAIARVHGLLLIASLLALALAALLSSAAAHWMSSTVRQLTRVASGMAGGDLTLRTRIKGRDEMTSLAHALNAMADGLSRTLNDLRTERDLQARILESMHEGVLVLDAQGRVAVVNAALRETLLLGADVVGRSPLEIIRNADLQAALDEARARGAPVSREVEIGGMTPRRLIVRASPLSGEPPGMVAVLVDVTDVRRLESIRKEFVANVSHELRTPIHAIRSAVETLMGGAKDEPAARDRFIAIIERHAERLGNLVEDLLELSRIESRQVKLSPAPLDCAESMHKATSLCQEQADRKGVRLMVEPPVGAIQVQADRRAVEQVLTNLVDNAIKYSPSGARVTLRAELRNGEVLMSVTDTGPGIAPRHVPHLFERFYRADTGRSRDMGGTGLGLSIVKHLVENMGGSVGVDSAEGKGSTFWFTLPPVEASSDAA
ncbi:MAG: ATP-binding protein [Myxococcota bacterium]